jgi:hypothetical protein
MTVRKLWFAAGLMLSATLVEAGEIRRPPAPALPVDESALPIIEASDEEIARWIDHLASSDFRTRQRALSRLRLVGRPVIAVVASRVAQSDELEAIVRGTSLLGEFSRSRDVATRTTARQALLVLSKNGNSSVAQRAHAILNPVDVSTVTTLRVRARGNAVFVNGPIAPAAPAPVVPVRVAPQPARVAPVAVWNAPRQARPPKPSDELERLQHAYDDARRLAAQDVVPSAELDSVIRHLERELVRQLERDVKGRRAAGL